MSIPNLAVAVSRRRTSLAPALLALLLSATPSSRAAEQVTYILRPRPADRVIDVELTWQTGSRPGSSMSVSKSWGTITDIPALLQNLTFTGAEAAERHDNRWLLKHRPKAELRAKYTVDAGRGPFDWDQTARPLTTATFFHGMGNAFLLVPEAGGRQPEEYEIILRWELPPDWSAACSWGTGPHVGALLKPTDLRHSVYLAGELKTKTEQRAGHRVEVALVDRFDFSLDDFAAMAADIIAQQANFMADTEFPPFVVTAIPVGEAVKAGDSRVSGMALYHSFVLFAAPQSTITEALEALFAHELFHYWNGRLLAAEDPQRLTYWFTEGFTDYYSLRILYQDDHWNARQYANWLNRHLREYARNPAIHATNEEIEQRYYSARDTVGEVAYQRGHLLALRWNALARRHGAPDGIDHLFKTLVQRARDSGFKVSNQSLRAAGIELLGPWFADEFDRFVVRAETVEVPPDALAPGFTGQVRPVYELDPGFDVQRSIREQCVRGLKPDSAAAKAGVREGENLAGWVVHGDPDRTFILRVLRDNKVKSISFYPRGERLDVLQFAPAGS